MATAAVRRRLTWQHAPVVAIEQETPRASRLVLEPPDWPGHLPGQHLDVRLTAPDGYTAQRSYSIATGTDAARLALLVERLPDGEVSSYLTEELRAGDELEVRGPVGGYFVWQVGLGGPLQLVAGGSGVVPFLAMIEHHQAAASDVPVRLLYSTRDLTDALGRRQGVGALKHVEVTYALTRAAPDGWTGPRGRLDTAALERHTFPPETRPRVFVCGPTGFVEAVSSALVELGHPPDRLKTERFGASGGPS
jgi:ferredoxin-NADP reductase